MNNELKRRDFMSLSAGAAGTLTPVTAGSLATPTVAPAVVVAHVATATTAVAARGVAGRTGGVSVPLAVPRVRIATVWLACLSVARLSVARLPVALIAAGRTGTAASARTAGATARSPGLSARGTISVGVASRVRARAAWTFFSRLIAGSQIRPQRAGGSTVTNRARLLARGRRPRARVARRRAVARRDGRAAAG